MMLTPCPIVNGRQLLVIPLSGNRKEQCIRSGPFFQLFVAVKVRSAELPFTLTLLIYRTREEPASDFLREGNQLFIFDSTPVYREAVFVNHLVHGKGRSESSRLEPRFHVKQEGINVDRRSCLATGSR